MTTTYDPTHPKYSDEADVRGELTRVYDICNGCRLCLGRCDAFPTLFELIERAGGTRVDGTTVDGIRVGGTTVDGGDAGRLTPLQQDQVVGECVQCNECLGACPYASGHHEWNVDVPRLMLRAKAMQYESGITPVSTKWALGVSGRTDLLGRLATSPSPLTALLRGRARSLLRAALGTAHVGASGRSAAACDAVNDADKHAVSEEASTERFSVWFARRRSSTTGPTGPTVPTGSTGPMGPVKMLPGCVVEYETPRLGTDLVEAYERAGIECSLSAAGCCGAPWLHAGDIGRFAKVAKRNVEVLAAEIRHSRHGAIDAANDPAADAADDVVVVDPACRRVIVLGYPDHVPGAEALFVARHTFDAVEYLEVSAHRGVRPNDPDGAADPVD